MRKAGFKAGDGYYQAYTFAWMLKARPVG